MISRCFEVAAGKVPMLMLDLNTTLQLQCVRIVREGRASCQHKSLGVQS